MFWKSLIIPSNQIDHWGLAEKWLVCLSPIACFSVTPLGLIQFSFYAHHHAVVECCVSYWDSHSIMKKLKKWQIVLLGLGQWYRLKFRGFTCSNLKKKKLGKCDNVFLCLQHSWSVGCIIFSWRRCMHLFVPNTGNWPHTVRIVVLPIFSQQTLTLVCLQMDCMFLSVSFLSHRHMEFDACVGLMLFQISTQQSDQSAAEGGLCPHTSPTQIVSDKIGFTLSVWYKCGVWGGGSVDFVGYIRSCCHFWTHLLNYIPIHTHSSVSVGRTLDCKVWRSTNAGLILWWDEGFLPESTFSADSCTVIAQPPCCVLHQYLQVHWKWQTQAAIHTIVWTHENTACIGSTALVAVVPTHTLHPSKVTQIFHKGLTKKIFKNNNNKNWTKQQQQQTHTKQFPMQSLCS